MHPFEIDTNYTRILPRDLFNEAKLLKCMGRLCLLIHDHMTPVKMEVDEEACESGFTTGLIDDGSLTIVNLKIKVKGNPILFKTTYNEKHEYPLFAFYEDCEYQVFNESGEWDEEFITFCEELPTLYFKETTLVEKPRFLGEWRRDHFERIEPILTKFFGKQETVCFNNELNRPPVKWESIRITYGFAYTSSSAYAAYWLCNGNLLYNDKFIVKGFTIGYDQNFYGVACDKEERKFIYFRLNIHEE